MDQQLVLCGILAGTAMEQLSCKAFGKFELISHRITSVMLCMDRGKIAQDG